MALPLKHATATQLLAAWRARFRDARGLEAGWLSRWILDRITDGTYTDAQLRTYLGLNTTQYNNLKTRITTRATRYDAVIADAGE